jgi:hypothetical protein
MTDRTMALRALPEKNSDSDVLREMVGFTAQRLMELEAESLTGAPYGGIDPAFVHCLVILATRPPGRGSGISSQK